MRCVASEDGLDIVSVAVLANVAARQRRAMPGMPLGDVPSGMWRAQLDTFPRAWKLLPSLRVCIASREAHLSTDVICDDSEKIGMPSLDACMNLWHLLGDCVLAAMSWSEVKAY